jgi:hypothetical protein
MRRSRVLLGVGLAGATAAALIGGPAAVNGLKNKSDAAYNMFGGRNPQEDKLTEAANKVFDIDTSVRCADPGDKDDIGKRMPITGIPVGATHEGVLSTDQTYIRIAPIACAAIAKLDGMRPGEFSKQPGDQRLGIAYAVSVLSVQAAGAKHPDADAGERECYGTQKAAALAQTLGLPRADAVQLGIDLSKAELVLADSGQLPPETCVNDGPYDLDPQSPFGFFPYGTNPTFELED